MIPTHYYMRGQRFLLAGISFILLGIFVELLVFADGQDDFVVLFFMPLVSLILIAGGIMAIVQSRSKNAMLSISDEGITIRYFPSLVPVFTPWINIWAVKMENDMMGQEVVVVLVKNPQEILLTTKGISKNHARNLHKMFGSPVAIRSGYVKLETIPVFKQIREEIEKRKPIP